MSDRVPDNDDFLFNPIKHHLGFIRDFIEASMNVSRDEKQQVSIIKEIRHAGGSVMDVYTGDLTIEAILNEALCKLSGAGVNERAAYRKWAGTNRESHRIITIADDSEWVLKYEDTGNKYMHIFPARYSQHTIRVKANTLKTAIAYLVFSGKDYVSDEDLNLAREITGLSPLPDVYESEAITEMIALIRG
ncbi:MAG: hypothetical protein U0X39_07870 [Bacteroidales bacterium]